MKVLQAYIVVKNSYFPKNTGYLLFNIQITVIKLSCKAREAGLSKKHWFFWCRALIVSALIHRHDDST
tara:strand:+ start:45 stop:248 length:204 start_codon:yes stop_codon:yes gene_type:complete